MAPGSRLPVFFLLIPFLVGVGSVKAETISLADLGFRDGAVMTAAQASSEIFFPLPRRPSGARLNLNVETSGLLEPGAQLIVKAGDVPLASFALDQVQRSKVSVEIPAEALQTDFIRVELTSEVAGALGGCSVATGAQSWVRLTGDSGIEVERGNGPQPLPAELWRRAVGEVKIGIPARPTLQQAEAALEIFGALRRRGARPAFVDLPASISGNAPDILIATPADLAIGSREPVAVLPSGARRGASLLIQSPEAARSLILLPEVLSAELALDSALARGVTPDSTKITLAALGYRERTLRLQTRTFETVDIPIHRLPQGRLPQAIVLFGQGSTLSAQEIVVADVFLDGVFIDSFAMRDDFGLSGRRIALPGDLVAENGGKLELRLRHLAREGHCSRDGSFQLRGTSYLELSEDRIQTTDLTGLFVSPDGQAHVAVQAEYVDRLREFLPLIANLLGDRAGPGASVSVGQGPPVTGLDRGPTIWFGRAPPADATQMPVEFGRGRIEIDVPAIQGRLSLTEPVEASVVQLVQTPRRQAVWIYPGAKGSVGEVDALSGTVAVLDGTHTITIDTRLTHKAVEYPEQRTFQDQLSLYRTELFILGWLLLSALALFLILRLRRGQAR